MSEYTSSLEYALEYAIERREEFEAEAGMGSDSKMLSDWKIRLRVLKDKPKQQQDYCIFGSTSLPKLEEGVREHLKNGWSLVGGPFTETEVSKQQEGGSDYWSLESCATFYQAMTRMTTPSPAAPGASPTT